MNRGRITAIASIVTPVAVGLAFGVAVVSGAAANTHEHRFHERRRDHWHCHQRRRHHQGRCS